jgi:hypothetical protein
LFHADGWTDVRELIVTFRSFAKAPKKQSDEKLETRPNVKVFNRIATEELRETRRVWTHSWNRDCNGTELWTTRKVIR